MKRLALLSLLCLSACARLPTESASRAPSNPRADGGMTMGGGLYTPPPCTDENGQAVTCP
jgi:hypothetical protein